MKASNRKLNVYEAIDRVMEGDEEAFKELYCSLLPKIRMKYTGKVHGRITMKDVEREAMDALWQSIIRWRPAQGMSFESFYFFSLENRFADMLREDMRAHFKDHGEWVSLDWLGEEMEKSDITAYYQFRGESLVSESQSSEYEFSLKFSALKGKLDEDEMKIIRMLYDGYKKKEVCQITGTTIWHVNQALAKAKSVLLSAELT